LAGGGTHAAAWPGAAGRLYKIASKAVWLGEVEAPEEASAIERSAVEFRVPANRMMAIPRWLAGKTKSSAMGHTLAIGKGSHSLRFHLFVPLLELLFRLFQWFGKTIVRRRRRKGRGV
jgi:hypothetical protein